METAFSEAEREHIARVAAATVLAAERAQARAQAVEAVDGCAICSLVRVEARAEVVPQEDAADWFQCPGCQGFIRLARAGTDSVTEAAAKTPSPYLVSSEGFAPPTRIADVIDMSQAVVAGGERAMANAVTPPEGVLVEADGTAVAVLTQAAAGMMKVTEAVVASLAQLSALAEQLAQLTRSMMDSPEPEASAQPGPSSEPEQAVVEVAMQDDCPPEDEKPDQASLEVEAEKSEEPAVEASDPSDKDVTEATRKLVPAERLAEPAIERAGREELDLSPVPVKLRSQQLDLQTEAGVRSWLQTVAASGGSSGQWETLRELSAAGYHQPVTEGVTHTNTRVAASRVSVIDDQLPDVPNWFLRPHQIRSGN